MPDGMNNELIDANFENDPVRRFLSQTERLLAELNRQIIVLACSGILFRILS